MNNSSSWIVAQGEVTFSYTQSRNQRPDKAVVGQDDVLHLRGLWQDDHMASFETMADARLLEIRYSCHCTCDQQVHDLTTE